MIQLLRKHEGSLLSQYNHHWTVFHHFNPFHTSTEYFTEIYEYITILQQSLRNSPKRSPLLKLFITRLYSVLNFLVSLLEPVILTFIIL
jgi:hypothetical protein